MNLTDFPQSAIDWAKDGPNTHFFVAADGSIWRKDDNGQLVEGLGDYD